MHTPRVVIADGENAAGAAFVHLLTQRGYRVTLLTREPADDSRAVQHVAWDGETAGPWTRVLEGACGLVNLHGAGLDPHAHDGLATASALSRALSECADPPPVWLQAGSVRVYGASNGARPADECTALGGDAEARAWHAIEEELRQTVSSGVRRAVYRLGLVLDEDSSSRQRLSALARWAHESPAARMETPLSWIHADDLARLLYWGLRMEIIAGPYNACVPGTARLKDVCRALPEAAGSGASERNTPAAVPGPLVHATPRRFIDIAYQFRNENLAQAIGPAKAARMRREQAVEPALR